MKSFFAFLLVCCVGVVASIKVSSRGDEHPVEKVITLLHNLMGKVEQQRDSEEITFTKYKYWCDNSAKMLSTSIADGKANIESLDSEIAGLEGQETQLTEQIAELGEELQGLATRAAKAQRIRNSEEALYTKADTDYDSTIKAIQDALKLLTDAHASTEPALVQSGAKAMSQAAKAKVVQALTLGSSLASASDALRIANFVDALTAPTRPDFAAEGDYDKHIDTYDFKSHSVIELLKGLQKQFEDEKLAAVKAETNAVNGFALAKQARDEDEKQATAVKTIKETELGTVQGDLATAKGSLASAQSDLEADEALHTSTQKGCDIKKQEYSERQTVRAGEIEAMKQAVKILAEVTGVRTEAPGNPVPPPSPVGTNPDDPSAEVNPRLLGFVQDAKDPKSRAIELLRESARQTHSKALEKLAKEIAAHREGPFDQVINEVEKLIFRLMQEQKDEDDHKNWCDLELNKTDTSIADKADKMAELSAKIAKATARAAELTDEIKEDNEMVAKVNDHMGQSAEIRAAGKEENALAVKDSKAAQVAIANAIAVLDAYYKETGMVEKQAWEFVQQPATLPAEPSTWSSSYTGLTDPTAGKSGVIAVLKEIATKFAEMEADTNAQEESDQHFYEQDMKNSKIEVARRTKEAEMKGEEKKRLADEVQTLSEQHKHVSDQKEATDQYLKDLQKACVDGDSTYEERAAARAQEIAALKQAQVILTDAFKQKASTTAAPTFLQRRSA